MRFLGKNQPVVPVTDLILQLLQCGPDSFRFLIALRRQLGDVARLLGSLAKIVQIGGIQQLHLGGQPREALQSYDARILLPDSPFGSASQGFLQIRQPLFQFRCQTARLGLHLFRKFPAMVLEPEVEIIGLLLDAGHPQTCFRHLQNVHPIGKQRWPWLLLLILAARFSLWLRSSLHQLLQKLAMHVQVPNGSGRLADPLQQAHGRTGGSSNRLARSAVRQFAHNVLQCRLQPACPGARVVHSIDVRIARAFLQILLQCGSQFADRLPIVRHARTPQGTVATLIF